MDEDIAETKWRESFRARLIHIQGNRTNQDMADLLEIGASAYSKYVAERMSQPPIRLLPKIAKIGAVSLEWLIEGERAAKPAAVKKRPAQRRSA